MPFFMDHWTIWEQGAKLDKGASGQTATWDPESIRNCNTNMAPAGLYLFTQFLYNEQNRNWPLYLRGRGHT